MHKKTPSKSASNQVLRNLVWLRVISIIAQLAAVLLVYFVIKMQIPLIPLLGIIGVLILWNIFSFWRLNSQFPVTESEITLSLSVDAIALAALLYFTGGSTNPFVSLFFVPVVLSAAFLGIFHVSWIVILCASLYSLLMKHYIYLPHIGDRFGGDFNLHIFGMWATFILSAIIAAVFVYSLARAGRKRDMQLVNAQQRLIRNEHILFVGTTAAGAAHEMNTPLNTITMLAEEIQNELVDNPQTKLDVQEILAQVELCNKQLLKLQSAATLARGDRENTQPLSQILHRLILKWGALRSEIKLVTNVDIDDIFEVYENHNLSLALTNLLDNAADASVEAGKNEIKISAMVENDDLNILIKDYGQGLNPEQIQMAGKVTFSTKDKGLGLGLMLSHATIENLNGKLTVDINNNGMLTNITIPLSSLTDSLIR